MTLSAAAGSLNTGTGAIGTTVVVSGLGFQPKVVLFWWSGRTDTVDAAGRANAKRGFGAAVTATDRRYSTTLAQDTPTSMVTNRMQGNAACIGVTTTADAIDGLMDLQSMDAGGFTLVVDDVFTLDYRIHYLALGGTDIVNVATGEFQKITTTGDQDITSVAFQPNFLLMFGSKQGTNNNSVSADANMMISVAKASGTGNQFVYMGGSNDAAANAQSISYGFDAEVIALPASAITTIDTRATFSSFLSNGFRINFAENSDATAHFFNFVAFNFTSADYVAVGDLLTQTDTTTDIVESGLGFSPVAAMFVSHGNAKSTQDTSQDDDMWSCGAFSSTSARAACATADDDAAGTAVVTTAIEHDAVLVNIDEAAGTVEALMDIKSVDSGGFTCIMDDAGAAQLYAWYWAIGVPATAKAPPPPRRPYRFVRSM